MKFLYFLFYCKFIYKKPEKKKIFIFDSALLHIFLKYFHKKNIELYNNRILEKPSINLFIILEMFKSLDLTTNNYKKILLNYVKPDLIITLNDNYESFYKIKNFYKKAIVVSVQSSWKNNSKLDIFYNIKKKNLQLQCDYIFCYNKYSAEMFKKIIDCKTINIGSFKSNSFLADKKKKYDYMLISQFRNTDDKVAYNDNANFYDWRFNEQQFFKNLSDYFFYNKKKIYILGSRTLEEEEEKNFFNKIFHKNNWEFIPQSKNRKTYNIIDQSRVVLCIDSTLGYESISRGNKTAFFAVRNFNKNNLNNCSFCWPKKISKKGFFWTNSYSSKEINRIISNIDNVSKKNWNRIYRKKMKDIIIYDKNNKNFIKIMKKISIPIKKIF
jgi:surface carbohydrate biosynthesis protein